MFDILFRLILAILPFHVILSIFFSYKLGVAWFSVYKEILLVMLAIFSIYWFISKGRKPNLDKLDYAIIGYFIYMIVISLFEKVWLKAIFYWWRYDFEFLLTFLLIRHSFWMLKWKISDYMRIFLFSWWAAIIIWILVRFVFWESILLNFWFSPKLSTWSFDSWVPIYHGIEWANVRRFQGIFDWPNQTAFFLIVYIWALFHYLKNRKERALILYFSVSVLFWLMVMTYSRSSILWTMFSVFLISMLNIKAIFKKYRSQFVLLMISAIIIWLTFNVRYWWNMSDIIMRAWSSKWHFERMVIWFKQFVQKPLWAWLSSSWPWYRLSHDIKWIDEKNFIPESWYVQQLVEWWIIWFTLFASIMLILLFNILKLSNWLAFALIWVLTMNLFLHTFEASYISILLFILLWIFLKKDPKEFNIKES